VPSAADGSFSLSGLSPEQKSHFIVLNPQRRMGAKITIAADHDSEKPLIVKLQPTQSANLAILDEAMQPVPNARISLMANIRLLETATGFNYREVALENQRYSDTDGICAFANLVAGGSYTARISAFGYATAQTHFRVEAGGTVELEPVTLLATGLFLSGSVVDQNGKPLEGVQVTIIPRNDTLAITNHHWLETKKDGQFRFLGLPSGKYRLFANLFKASGEKDMNGNPVKKLVATTELNVELPNILPYRVILQWPP
jgi:hypothetical protein